MKIKLSCCLFLVILACFLFVSCEEEAPPVPTEGSIKGRVVYSSSDNGVVSVSIEKRDGVSTSGTIYRQTRANDDGSYAFINIPAGQYTVLPLPMTVYREPFVRMSPLRQEEPFL